MLEIETDFRMGVKYGIGFYFLAKSGSVQLHENGPLEVLRYGNMDIDQICRAEVVCFTFHDDLLFPG